MKQTEIKALRAKSLPELQAVSHENRERLRALRLDLAAGKVKNVREIRAVRKDIARIQTVVRSRQNTPGTAA